MSLTSIGQEILRNMMGLIGPDGVLFPNEDYEACLIAELQSRGFTPTEIGRALDSMGLDSMRMESKRKRAQRLKDALRLALKRLDPEALTDMLPDGKTSDEVFQAASPAEQRCLVNLVEWYCDFIGLFSGTDIRIPSSTK
jgi:hypothetical protein